MLIRSRDLRCLSLLFILALAACSGSGKPEISLESRVQTFVIKTESKYKRHEERNEIDLHFRTEGDGRIHVVVTYRSPLDRVLADSIADAAVEMVRRNLNSDPELNGESVSVDKIVRQR